MNIVVFLKRVPDTEARIKIIDGTAKIEKTGVKFVTNPYDEFALEAALRVREANGNGEVTVISVGDGDSVEVLRSGLALGADSAVLLRTDAAPEGLAAAQVIAGELGQRQFDLALFGLKAIDDDLQAVAAMVGTILEIPAVTAVSEFAVANGMITAQRQIEGGIEKVEVGSPCVLSITKGAYEPRYASLKGIMAAKKKPIEEKEISVEENGIIEQRLQYPPERKPGRIIGQGADAVSELVRLLREEAKVI